MNGGGTDFAASSVPRGMSPSSGRIEQLLTRRQWSDRTLGGDGEMAGITPAITICELLDDDSGNALSKEDARRYARKHGLVFVEGDDVLAAWEEVPLLPDYFLETVAPERTQRLKSTLSPLEFPDR